MLSGLTLAVLNFRKDRLLRWEIQQRVEDAARTNRQLEEHNLELARAAELAREAKESARRAEQAKGRFLAMASHDLRQPLQAVSLLNGTLQRMVKDPQIKQALGRQDEAIGSMSQLLNALLEDDPDVRNATRMLLATEGYAVVTAASLAEARQRLHESGGTDLLVTDFHLAAGETGVEVISRLREESGTTLKAVLLTGDSSSAVRDLAQDPDLRLVSKPVQAEAFLEIVREQLAG